ncbi:MAG: hypothetical protein KAI66_04935 [Lentisphaeria bacterium]|nr:hypothetical protein [Lentisphaeria bacterium]
MKKLISRLGNEWEKSFFWGMLLVFFLVVALQLAPLGNDGGRMVGSGLTSHVKPYLTDQALTFLGVHPASKIGQLHAFTYSQRISPPRIIVCPGLDGDSHESTNKDTAGSSSQQETDRPSQKKPESSSQPTTEPRLKSAENKSKLRVKASRVVEFKGIYVSTTGKKLACVRVKDPLSKKMSAKAGFWNAGDMVNGVEIQRFDNTQLSVLSPQRAAQVVPMGKRREIVIE